jgi:hypothetical protein
MKRPFALFASGTFLAAVMWAAAMQSPAAHRDRAQLPDERPVATSLAPASPLLPAPPKHRPCGRYQPMSRCRLERVRVCEAHGVELPTPSPLPNPQPGRACHNERPRWREMGDENPHRDRR